MKDKNRLPLDKFSAATDTPQTIRSWEDTIIDASSIEISTETIPYYKYRFDKIREDGPITYYKILRGHMKNRPAEVPFNTQGLCACLKVDTAPDKWWVGYDWSTTLERSKTSPWDVMAEQILRIPMEFTQPTLGDASTGEILHELLARGFHVTLTAVPSHTNTQTDNI